MEKDTGIQILKIQENDDIIGSKQCIEFGRPLNISNLLAYLGFYTTDKQTTPTYRVSAQPGAKYKGGEV